MKFKDIKADMDELKQIIESIYGNNDMLKKPSNKKIICEVIDMLDKGKLRVAEPCADGWKVNIWIKKSILLYFMLRKVETIKSGCFEFYDKIPLKKNYSGLKVRVVPCGIARYGSYLAQNVVMMPSYVNIGAYVDSGTMIDTWATIGSGAQIGKNVHVSGGVGIGGVLEPVNDTPVIVEDGVFIGSRSVLVEGVRICREAVLGANVVITGSTKIIDVTDNKPVEYKSIIPPRSVVIPGTYAKQFPAGNYNINCALIIGKRKKSTDLKTSLNNVLREFNVEI